MDRLLLVDGSNLLFQMFYGMPNAIPAPDGRDIRGTVGFIGALRKLLLQVKPTHAAVLFDGECTNPRYAVEESYKANRPDYSQMPLEETPFGQLEEIYRALDTIGIAHRETDNCETDDWIAGYALTYGDSAEVVICSFDSDYFQLITDRVSVLRYRGERSVVWTPEIVREKLGIEPGMYAAYKALTGDTADNIPGVPKVGPKTAAAIMRQFGSMEALRAQTDKIERPQLREAILGNRERILKNYALIRLENRTRLPFTLEELVCTDISYTTGEILARIGLR